jgi:hypothetical protein
MIQTQYQTISHSDKDFYLEYGWASCFECDVVFYDLEELDEHQEIHLKEESDAKR